MNRERVKLSSNAMDFELGKEVYLHEYAEDINGPWHLDIDEKKPPKYMRNRVMHSGLTAVLGDQVKLVQQASL